MRNLVKLKAGFSANDDRVDLNDPIMYLDHVHAKAHTLTALRLTPRVHLICMPS